MKVCAVLLLGLLLAACAPAYYPTPSDGVLLPEQLQRAADAYTATARVMATEAALATATDQAARNTATAAAQATLGALAVQQTQSALELTQAAGAALATDAADGKTQAASETRAAATPTAAAIRTQAAVNAAETARNQAQAETVAEFWQTIRFIIAALFVVGGLTAITVVAIDRVSRVRVAMLRERAFIAREAFKMLPPGHWAEWQPGEGYQVYQLPGGLDEPAVIIENAVANPSHVHAWRHAVRLFAWWGDRYGFGIADIGPTGAAVVSDPDWRVLSKLLKDARVLADMPIPNKKGRKTAWAAEWSFARLADELGDGRLALPFPAQDAAPKVAFAVPTQQQN